MFAYWPTSLSETHHWEHLVQALKVHIVAGGTAPRTTVQSHHDNSTGEATDAGWHHLKGQNLEISNMFDEKSNTEPRGRVFFSFEKKSFRFNSQLGPSLQLWMLRLM